MITGIMYHKFYITDLKFYGLYIAIELVQLGILVTCLSCVRNACADVIDSGRSCFPFKKLFTLKNPMQLGAFLSALTICVPKILSRIIYDANLGAPESLKETLTMIAYYTFDIICGVVEYFAIILILMRIDSRLRAPNE